MWVIILVLTVLLVLNCLVLMLLVLMQLPKKEAGAGLAFGGGATDALFGAGSGNVLTKATKYGCGFFFSLALLLSVLNAYQGKRGGARLEEHLNQLSAEPVPAAQVPAPATAPGTNLMLSTTAATNPLLSAPAAPTNAPAK
jgi:preprotein translocase subunit SecG